MRNFLIAALFVFLSSNCVKAQLNFQCVTVAITKGVNHQCSPAIGPIRCAARKGAFTVARYFECTNPLSTLRNFRWNRDAALWNYRDAGPASRYQRFRLFERRYAD